MYEHACTTLNNNMPSNLSKGKKKRSDPFSTRKRWKRKPKTKLSEENKIYLAATDKGSYFNQVKQWPQLLSENNSNNPNLSSSISRSRKKLETGKESFLKRKADELELSETECEDVSDDSGSELAVESQSAGYDLPKNGNFVCSVACLQQMLENAAICKDCHNPLVLLEKTGSRQGLAALWLFNCINSACTSHVTRVPIPTSERTGQKYNINVSSVVAFRAIGKGRTAAEKCFAILDLPSPVYTWDKHTKVIRDKLEVLNENCMKDAALEVKQFMRDCGKIPECPNEELDKKLVDVGTSFDCSWSSRGWSARDGVVAAISEDTGKVVDTAFMSSSCPGCKAMEDKHAQGKISKFDYLDWYIKHEPSCEKNHDGSAQVNKKVTK